MRITENENAYSTRERQDLIYKYLLENTDKDHVVATKRILNYLDTFDIQTHINTLYNDFREIEMVYGVTIEYNQKKKGYQLKDTMFKPDEIRLIAHSLASFKFITETKAKHLIDKLNKLTDQYTASSVYSDAYILNHVHSGDEETVINADRLYQAIVEDKQIRFDFPYFMDFDEKKMDIVMKPHPMITSPYKLMWKNGRLYVLLFEHYLEKFMIYSDAQIKNVSKPLNIPRMGKEQYYNRLKEMGGNREFDIDEFFGRKPCDVRFTVEHFYLPKLVERFGSDYEIEKQGLTTLIVKMTIKDTIDFFNWIIISGACVRLDNV